MMFFKWAGPGSSAPALLRTRALLQGQQPNASNQMRSATASQHMLQASPQRPRRRPRIASSHPRSARIRAHFHNPLCPNRLDPPPDVTPHCGRAAGLLGKSTTGAGPRAHQASAAAPHRIRRSPWASADRRSCTLAWRGPPERARTGNSRLPSWAGRSSWRFPWRES